MDAVGNVFWWNVWVIVSAVAVIALVIGAVVIIKRAGRRATDARGNGYRMEP